MQCPTCGGPVPPMPRDTGGARKLYCSLGCKARARNARAGAKRREAARAGAKRREAELVTPPEPHPCPACGEPVAGRLYCSRPCVDHAKTLRYRADPEYAAERRTQWRAKARRYREAERAAGPYRPPRVTLVCNICCGKHHCMGLCRKHYGQANPKAKTKVVRATLHAMVTRGGHTEQRPVAVRITVGVMVECPGCDAIMGAVTPTRRWCLACDTRVTLNADEVAWLPVAARDDRRQHTPEPGPDSPLA